MLKIFFAFSYLICVVDRCFSLYFSPLDSFLPFLVLFVGVGTDLCGSCVSSCPRVQLGCLEPKLLNPQGASTQGLPERRVRLDSAGTLPQDHNLDLGSVLHVTSDPGDPVPRSRASTPAASTLLILQWTMWPSHLMLHSGLGPGTPTTEPNDPWGLEVPSWASVCMFPAGLARSLQYRLHTIL